MSGAVPPTRRAAVALACAMGLTSATIVVTPARAADVVAARPAPTRLWLAVANGLVVRRHHRRTVLTCDPAGGTHRYATAACAALAAAKGHFDALPATSGTCTEEYAPVTVAADGWWRNRVVHYRRTFPNACAMGNATGPVFRR